MRQVSGSWYQAKQKRKEAKIMYRKPSITVLGDAATVIQGQKVPPITVDEPNLHEQTVVAPAYDPKQ
jgi:hypothetical protein